MAERINIQQLSGLDSASGDFGELPAGDQFWDEMVADSNLLEGYVTLAFPLLDESQQSKLTWFIFTTLRHQDVDKAREYVEYKSNAPEPDLADSTAVREVLIKMVVHSIVSNLRPMPDFWRRRGIGERYQNVPRKRKEIYENLVGYLNDIANLQTLQAETLMKWAGLATYVQGDVETSVFQRMDMEIIDACGYLRSRHKAERIDAQRRHAVETEEVEMAKPMPRAIERPEGSAMVDQLVNSLARIFADSTNVPAEAIERYLSRAEIDVSLRPQIVQMVQEQIYRQSIKLRGLTNLTAADIARMRQPKQELLPTGTN